MDKGLTTMLKLVVFDCDGVMFDSRETNRAYYNQLLAGFNCSPMDEEEVGYVHAHNVFDALAHIFRNHDHINMDTVNRYREELDYTPFLHQMLMAPDLLQFLEAISPNYHRAISTNRTNTMDMVLDIFNLRPWFEMVVTALTAPRPKPAPDGLYMILDHFGLQVDEAIYIGDSSVDRDHCAAVGMELISFNNPGLEAPYHVDCFMDVLKLPPFRC
ncbi:MAG: HAD hydrolase-like protein [Thermodesulfobacteriota bacterium]|nr:HAD hydrolase-like protein [Thermodesulfobacteriota bacterium]